MNDKSSIDAMFRYELAKRSTHGGIARAALGGDREAIRDFAGLAVVAVESGNSNEMADIREWLIEVLSRIEAGDEPNDAFGWKRKRKGAPSPSQDFDGLMKQWLVGQHMAGLVNSGKSQRAAAKAVAVERHVSEAEATRCYRAFVHK